MGARAWVSAIGGNPQDEGALRKRRAAFGRLKKRDKGRDSAKGEEA